MSSVVRHYDVTELHPSLHPPVAVPLGRQQSTRIRGGIRWSPHSSPDDGLGTMATNSHTSPECWATCEERESCSSAQGKQQGSEVTLEQFHRCSCWVRPVPVGGVL